MKNIAIVFILLFLISSCGNNTEKSANKEDNISVESSAQSQKVDSIPCVVPSKLILTGKFNPSEVIGFVKVPEVMSSKPIFIQKDVLSAFIKMREAAAKENVNLYIVSGTRTFSDQKAIWERKWNSLISTNSDSLSVAREILKFSSMPGTSRHHWGTDIDLVSVDPVYFESGDGDKMFKWLVTHAGEYGFCQVYSSKEETQRTGYSMEKWHWSFMPISSNYLKAYSEQINYSDIQGFIGDKLPARLRIKEDYVQGIDARCAN